MRQLGLLGIIDIKSYLASEINLDGTAASGRRVRRKGNHGDGRTVGEVVREWLGGQHVRVKADKTKRDYTWLMEHYALPELGEVRMAELTAARVEKLVNDMEEDDLAPRTRKYMLTVLGMALDSGIGTYWMVNPSRGIQIPDHEVEKAHAMTEEDLAAYTEWLGEDTLDVALLLSLGAGTRPGETMGLKVGDIERSKGVRCVSRCPRRNAAGVGSPCPSRWPPDSRRS